MRAPCGEARAYSGRQSINDAAFPREQRRYPSAATETAEHIHRLRFTARNKTKTTVSRFTSYTHIYMHYTFSGGTTH